MKHLITIAVVAAAAYFGYKFEPDLRLSITGIPYGVGHKILNGSLPNVDLTALRPDQLPKEVTIFTAMPFKDTSANLVINFTPKSSKTAKSNNVSASAGSGKSPASTNTRNTFPRNWGMYCKTSLTSLDRATTLS